MPAPPIDDPPHPAQRTAERPPRGRQERPREQILEEADGAPGCADCAGEEGRGAEDALGEGVELVGGIVEEFFVVGEGEEGVVGGEEFGEGGEGGEEVAEEGGEAGGGGGVEGRAGEEGVGGVGGGGDGG